MASVRLSPPVLFRTQPSQAKCTDTALWSPSRTVSYSSTALRVPARQACVAHWRRSWPFACRSGSSFSSFLPLPLNPRLTVFLPPLLHLPLSRFRLPPSPATTSYQSGRLIEINSHSLFSKWFSESGKLVQRLFSQVNEMVDDEECFVVVLIGASSSFSPLRLLASKGDEADSYC